MPSIKIVHNGATYEVSTQKELQVLLETLGLLPKGAKLPGVAQTPASMAGLTLYLVVSEVAANPRGIDSDRVSTLAELKSSKALAGLSRTWSKMLGDLGFKYEEVIVRERRGEKYFWLPGPRAAKAVTALEKARLEGLI